MDPTNILVALLVPIVTGVVGAVGILIRDLYNRRSEMGRRKYAMDDATGRVTFAAEWWKAKQALGSTPDDEAARAIAESWLEEATSLVSEALHPPRRPEPDRSVTRRILLAYPFQRWTARLLRVAYYLLLAFMALGAFGALAMTGSPDIKFGEAVSITIGVLIFYGLLALVIRAWAVSIENRAAKQRTSVQPFVPTGGPTALQPGWYPDPSGVPGQRYWDGQQWIAVAPGSTQVHHEGRVRSGAPDGSRTE
jgi:hypothetical protein